MASAPGQLVDPAAPDLHVSPYTERHVVLYLKRHIRLYTDRWRILLSRVTMRGPWALTSGIQTESFVRGVVMTHAGLRQ